MGKRLSPRGRFYLRLDHGVGMTVTDHMKIEIEYCVQ